MKAIAALAALACVAGCAAPQAPQRSDRSAPAVTPTGYAELTTRSSAPTTTTGPQPGRDCGATLNPARLNRGADGQPTGRALDRVRSSEHGLVVGISQTSRQFSNRDLSTGELTGFEVEIVNEIAKELFGDAQDKRKRLITMPTANRFYALRTDKNADERAKRPELKQIQQVDMVIADVSVTCGRVDQYGLRYSAPYLATHSGLMVRKEMENLNKNIEPKDLRDRRVCSGVGTTNSNDMTQLAEQQKTRGEVPLIPVAVADTSECLMLLQRGQIDAIYTDVLILEGFRLQDPGTVLLPYRAPRYAEAAIAMGDKDEDLVRFVNGVLDRMRADGSLQKSYEKWFNGIPRELLLDLPPVRYTD